jgi:hypothetical protein
MTKLSNCHQEYSGTKSSHANHSFHVIDLCYIHKQHVSSISAVTTVCKADNLCFNSGWGKVLFSSLNRPLRLMGPT